MFVFTTRRENCFPGQLKHFQHILFFPHFLGVFQDWKIGLSFSRTCGNPANTPVSCLLLVDNAAVVAKSVKKLQTLLHLAEPYLESKKLKLNASKTETFIFQK